MSGLADGAVFRFDATLVRFDSMYGVRVPAAVSKAVGRGNAPVEVRVAGGIAFRATFIASGSGRHLILLNAQVRAAAGLKLGKPVPIEARVDRGPREVPVPPDLADALDEEGVRRAWESLPPGKREHILKWIDDAAREETRAKRVARAVEEAVRRREKDADGRTR
jgi:hypothetical protein